jgi:capsular exopolysaccharide synthesis family protein
MVPSGNPNRRIVYSRTPTVEIPPHVLQRHRVTSVNPDTTADAFRMLRTQVLMQMRQHGWQTLAITSPNKGAGKSTVALNLAISFAMELDYTALLVDADLRDPDVRHMLELEPGPGLADYLMGKAAIEDLLIHPNIGNLVVLPGGAPITYSSELMRSPMMADMIRELRSRYRDRLIVFDVPPILSGADTLALSSLMDATLLLVEECKSRKEDIERSFELLRGSNLIGIVLNKSRELREPEPITRPKAGLWQRFFGADG